MAPPHASGGIWQHSKTFLVITTGGGKGVLLASSRLRPRMLLNNLKCTGQFPPQRMIQPQMSIVLRLKNPELKDTNSQPGLLTMTTSKDFIAALPQSACPVYVSPNHKHSLSPIFLMAEPRLREAKAPSQEHTVRK